MPVKSLEHYLFERSLPTVLPIEQIKNCRLGIDVNHYLSRLLGPRKEQNLDATGGFPQPLKQYIESDLQVFKEFNITPIFVFSGNDIVDQYDLKNSKDLSPSEKQRNKAWSSHSSSQNQNQSPFPLVANEPFRDYNTPFAVEPITRELIDFFNQLGLEYFVAPYLSWAQLSYFYEKEYIDAIYGPTEVLLLQNVDKFILAMEFIQKEFRFVDKRKVLNEFRINPQQLLDISISVGCDLQPTILPIYPGGPIAHLFDMGLNMVNNGGSIYGSILALNNEDVTGRFQKGVLALQHLPVMKFNGRVELTHYDENDPKPNPESHPPSDIHEIIGQRLPHEYFFYESMGLINPKILESIVYGTYVEKAPLDGGASTQYRALVRSIINNFKNKEINLLTQNLSRYYHFKKIFFVKYFDSDNVELDNRIYPPISKKIDGIVIRSDEKDFSLSKLLSSLTNENVIGKRAIDVAEESERLQTDYEVISTSLIRSLSLLGFADVKDGKLISTKWTKALYSLKDLDADYQEELLLLLTFFKLDAFKLTDPFTPALVGGPKSTDEKEISIALLFSRLAAFIQIDQKRQQYNGPISRNLLAFRSSIDLVKTKIRELLECVLVNASSNNEVAKLSRQNPDWRKLVSQMPFNQGTPSTILAIIFQSFIDIYFRTKNLAHARDEVFQYYNQIDSLASIPEDFQKGLKFIVEAFKLVKVLNEDGLIDSKIYDTFVKVDELAQEALNLK